MGGLLEGMYDMCLSSALSSTYAPPPANLTIIFQRPQAIQPRYLGMFPFPPVRSDCVYPAHDTAR